jgi:hypothetical protein
MKLLSLALMGSILAPAAAQAATINSASYDASTQLISVDVTYGGGCKKHTFKLKMNACAESFPVQCTADLIDLTKGDFCEALVSQTVTFKAADYGLMDSYYDNASLVIKGSDDSEAFIQLTRLGGGNVGSGEKVVTCPTSSGKIIKFLPEFGEVHYLNADGSDWKSHDDGLNFKTLILESHPPQISVTIKDDEGEKVGGWLFTDGAASFSAQYRGKTYRGCTEN